VTPRGTLATLGASVLKRLFACGGIVAYHGVVEEAVSPEMHVTPPRFREQLEFLRAEFNVLPLSEFLERLASGRSVRRCAAISFDDAYVGVVRLAAPILRELGLPATLFVVSESAASTRPFWWDVAEDARTRGDGAEWDRLLHLAHLPPLARDMDALGVLRCRVLARLAGRFPGHVVEEYEGLHPDLLPASFDALRGLARDELFEFGCHTATHPALPFLEAGEQERELRESMDRLFGELPRVRRIVAYPYGLFDDATVAAAKRAGLRFGVTADGRAPSGADDPLRVPRLTVQEGRPVSSISLRLNSGLRPLLVARDGGPQLRLPQDPPIEAR
jgi:peptidoglycan/xylan/chitin deacetylase (PgdA/CDA1 family)